MSAEMAGSTLQSTDGREHFPIASAGSSTLADVTEIVGIVLLFFLVGSGPPPGINEPHYLTRAKHTWDSSFCERDLFLQTRDAHAVFFGAFGWMTRWVSLPAAAWIGRWIGWVALATAWQRLTRALIPRRGASLLSAALWMTLVQRFHMSGEWIVGGIEGKIIAYAIVLWGLSHWVQGHWNRTWILYGAAAAFHVLVGGWAVVATIIAGVIEGRGDGSQWRRSLPGLMIGGALALAGLIPALRLTYGVSADVARRAQEIYVFDRISHHLLIREFDGVFVVRHFSLILVFAVLVYFGRQDSRFVRLAHVVGGAIAIVVVGAVLDIGLGESSWSARLLRYYWFRASDVFVPIGVAIGAVLTLPCLRAKNQAASSLILSTLIVLVAANVVVTVNQLHFQTVPAADRQGGIRTTSEWLDWKDACGWIKDNLPPDAMLLTPTDHQTFKWYAHRGEVVTWKDVPQDAESIVKWSEALARVRRWQSSETLSESSDRLESLQRDYPFSHIVLRWPTSFPMPVRPIVFKNSSYAVFRAR